MSKCSKRLKYLKCDTSVGTGIIRERVSEEGKFELCLKVGEGPGQK